MDTDIKDKVGEKIISFLEKNLNKDEINENADTMNINGIVEIVSSKSEMTTNVITFSMSATGGIVNTIKMEVYNKENDEDLYINNPKGLFRFY